MTDPNPFFHYDEDADNVRHGFITWKRYVINLEAKIKSQHETIEKLKEFVEYIASKESISTYNNDDAKRILQSLNK